MWPIHHRSQTIDHCGGPGTQSLSSQSQGSDKNLEKPTATDVILCAFCQSLLNTLQPSKDNQQQSLLFTESLSI